MRIVFLSTFPPEPIMSGFAMRVHGILEQAPDQFEILRIYPASEAKKYPAHVSFSTSVVSRLKEICGMIPSIMLPYCHAKNLQTIKNRITEFNPHLVIVSGIHVFPFAPLEFPILYDAHNVEWHLSRGLFKKSTSSPVVKMHRFITMMKLKRKENALVKGSNIVIACSENNAEYFSKLRGDTVSVVHNGTDIKYWSVKRNPEKGLLLFPGEMSYFPNIDAAEFIVGKILPELKKRGWIGKIVLCGRNPHPRVKLLAGKDVEVTGTLKDIRSYYSRAQVLLAPLGIGSGTPLKIVTGLAAGVPIVTMPRVAESLGISEQQVVLQAETASDFADQVMKLQEDNLLAESLSARGRKIANERYSWATVGSRFWEEVERFLNSSKN